MTKHRLSLWAKGDTALARACRETIAEVEQLLYDLEMAHGPSGPPDKPAVTKQMVENAEVDDLADALERLRGWPEIAWALDRLAQARELLQDASAEGGEYQISNWMGKARAWVAGTPVEPKKALDEMVRLSEEAGLYDEPTEEERLDALMPDEPEGEMPCLICGKPWDSGHTEQERKDCDAAL